MWAPEPSWRAREAPGERSESERAAQVGTHAGERAEPVNHIVCAACGGFVTWLRERIERDGAHLHTFLNPEGLLFRIRCFASAPGVMALGERSDHWTWFKGFHWRACVCRACFEHLGWSYDRPAAQFYGLIAERVLELGEGEPRG